MKNLFVCTTKYQLFNIINIIHQNYIDDSNDLYVLDCIENVYKDLVNIARKSNYFVDVSIICAGKVNSTKDSYKSALKRCLFPSSMGLKKITYEQIFITGTEFYSRLIAAYYLNRCKKGVLFYYEDGMGSYTDILSNKFDTKSNKILELKYHISFVDQCKGLYVYKTKYVLNNPHNIPLLSIKSLVAGDPYCLFLYNLFTQDNRKTKIKEKAVFFDAFFTNMIDVEESKSIIETLKNIIGRKLIVKPHPSCAGLWRGQDINIWNTSDSFEIKYLLGNMGDKIYISAYSTASLLPKLAFDEEPTVILLYNLYSRFPDIWENGDVVYRLMQKDYAKNNNFYIPDNREQFISILNKLV